MGNSVFVDVYRVLLESEPDRKVELTHALRADWDACALTYADPGVAPELIDEPGRPARPQLVEPRDVPKRKSGTIAGQAALVHAIAHIEFNAINLACDAVYRFRDMPRDFYTDWLRVADEEASHFILLRDRLRELGHEYGDFEAHDGLWSMARQTRGDVLERMALVPRVLEAKGLDATPRIVQRLRGQGDKRTVSILEDVIYRDEIEHVRIGSKWFYYCCDRRGWDPETTFIRLVDHYMPGQLRGPFNFEARVKAGFSSSELDMFRNLPI